MDVFKIYLCVSPFVTNGAVHRLVFGGNSREEMTLGEVRIC